MNTIEAGDSHIPQNFDNKNSSSTYDPQEAAEWLLQRRVVAAEFGEVIALFCINDQDLMDTMAHIKEAAGGRLGSRDNKANVLTTSFAHNSSVARLPGLRRDLPSDVHEIISNALSIGSIDQPIGLLLPADEGLISSGAVPKRIIGAFTANGEKSPTVGIMVSGPSDIQYNKMIDTLNIPTEEKFVAGTSGNASGDPDSRGSGHHHWGKMMRQFASQEVCFLVPDTLGRALKSREGGSTSMAHINEQGVATLVREGSIPMGKMIDILLKAGVKGININPELLKRAFPFDYRESDIRLRMGDLLVWTGVRFKLPRKIFLGNSNKN